MSGLKLQFNAWDRFVGVFAPERAIRNAVLRARIQEYGSGKAQAASGSYHGGSTSMRMLRSWMPGNGSADADTLYDLPKLRERSSDAIRNEPVAGAAVRDAVSNVIGRGLSPQSTPYRQLLRDVTDAEIEETQAEFEGAFWAWSQTRACDFSRLGTFRNLTRMAYRSPLEKGDCLALIRQRPAMGSPFQTCVQLIEAERLENPGNAAEGAPAPDRPDNRLLGGVERNKNGVPVAYWISNDHPGEINTSGRATWKRVSAVGSVGQRLVLHLVQAERIGQTRGVPFLAPVIEILHTLSGYSRSEVQAALVSSYFTVAVENPNGDGFADPEWSATGGVDGAAPAAADGEIAMGPASIFELKPGQKISTINPGRPNTAYEPFVMAQLKQLGARLGIPLEVLTKHFESSYSAARSALASAWRFYFEERAWFVDEFCQPIWETVILEAIALGLVKVPKGFFDSDLIRMAWLASTWHGPAPAQLDPVKEAAAGKMLVDEGFSTRAEVTAQLTGGDWESKHPIRVREERMRREGKLDREGTAERVETRSAVEQAGSKPGGQPPGPPPPDEDPKDDGEAEDEAAA